MCLCCEVLCAKLCKAAPELKSGTHPIQLKAQFVLAQVCTISVLNRHLAMCGGTDRGWSRPCLIRVMSRAYFAQGPINMDIEQTALEVCQSEHHLRATGMRSKHSAKAGTAHSRSEISISCKTIIRCLPLRAPCAGCIFRRRAMRRENWCVAGGVHC
jgi:hypothetical protein